MKDTSHRVPAPPVRDAITRVIGDGATEAVPASDAPAAAPAEAPGKAAPRRRRRARPAAEEKIDQANGVRLEEAGSPGDAAAAGEGEE